MSPKSKTRWVVRFQIPGYKSLTFCGNNRTTASKPQPEKKKKKNLLELGTTGSDPMPTSTLHQGMKPKERNQRRITRSGKPRENGVSPSLLLPFEAHLSKLQVANHNLVLSKAAKAQVAQGNAPPLRARFQNAQLNLLFLGNHVIQDCNRDRGKQN